MLNIAVVDDDLKFLAIYIKIITEAFSKNKVSVSIQKFSSGSEFISSVNDRKYDLIFMDIDMPELSGIDIAAEMRKRNSNLDIIFVSCELRNSLCNSRISTGYISNLCKLTEVQQENPVG